MKTTHTPGPWTIDGRTYDIARADTHNADVMEIVTIRHRMDEIAYVPSLDTGNARLIAAAPDLLEALQRIVAWADAGCDPSSKSIEAARALIKRVTGERTTAS